MSGEFMPCPIWGTKAVILNDLGGGFRLRSDRTGGEYRISEEAVEEVFNLTVEQQMILTTWLVEQRRFGRRSPIISTTELDEILERRLLRLSERKERFFRFLIANNFDLLSTLALQDDFPDVSVPVHPQHLLAWTECRNFKEGMSFLRLLLEEGYLLQNDFLAGWVALTAKGFAKLEEYETGSAETHQAFVAMWFGAEMNDAWDHGFQPGIEDAGYKAFRIDNKEHNGKIDDEIVVEIKQSRFLIADFTCGVVQGPGKSHAVPRGGVYYEAGYAHGLSMPVIFSVRADQINDVHFDVRQFSHIVWNDPADLRAKLSNRIIATMPKGPLVSGYPKS